MALLVVTVSSALVACSESTRSPTASISTVAPSTTSTTIPPVQPRLASNAVQLAGDLVTDEQALRDPSSSEAVLSAAAKRQQAAYRALARHPDWNAVARPLIPPSLLDGYDRNVDARLQLDALVAERSEGHPARVAHRPTGARSATARLLPPSGDRDRGGLELPGGDQPD